MMIIPKYGNDFYPADTLNFEDDRGKIVYYGLRNDFPTYIIELYNKSAINATAINAIKDGIIGNGLTTENEQVLEIANRDGESWNDIFKKVALDRALFGGFAVEVIWSNDRTKITDVYHIDFSYVRAHRCNERGITPGYYISNEFQNKGRLRVKDEDVIYIPRFNKLDRSSPSQIYYYNPYTPGMRYYPLPDYTGGLNIIALDAEIDNFHKNNIANGLAPSLSITTFTDADNEEREAIERQLRSAYAGSNNAGSLIYMDVASKDEAPIITPIPQNGADGYYTTINDLTVQKILTAHRITSPMLLGIKTEGQLGGRAEMIDAMQLWQHNVINPLQQDILKQLEVVMSVNYENIVLGVETVTLFDDGTTQEEVVTSVEATDAEDTAIQTQETITTLQ